MSQPIYLESLYRCRQKAREAVSESPVGPARVVTEDIEKLLDNSIRRLEGWEADHAEVLVQTVQEQDRAKRDLPYPRSDYATVFPEAKGVTK